MTQPLSWIFKVTSWGGGGEGVHGLIFAGYVPLASQSPYPVVVYSVANYDEILT